MQTALLQSCARLVGLQETAFKQGARKADGYWMDSTGPEVKKYGITLAVNTVLPYATTARRDLKLQPRHLLVLHMGHRILIARLRAPLLDECIYALHAPHANAAGRSSSPLISGGRSYRTSPNAGRPAWCSRAQMRGSARTARRGPGSRRRRTARRATTAVASSGGCCRTPTPTLCTRRSDRPGRLTTPQQKKAQAGTPGMPQTIPHTRGR